MIDKLKKMGWKRIYMSLFYSIYFCVSIIGFYEARNVIMVQNYCLLIKIILYVALFWMIYCCLYTVILYPFSGFSNRLRSFFISYFKSLIFVYFLFGYVSFFYPISKIINDITWNQFFAIIIIPLCIAMEIPYFVGLFRGIYSLIKKIKL